MKCFSKCLVFLLAFTLSFSTAKAQGGSFNEGDVLFSPGISLGYYYGNTFSIPISLSAEVGLSDFFGVGAFVDYAQFRYVFPGFSDYSITSIGFGALGSFHYWGLIDELVPDLDLLSDKFDLYVTLALGYRILNERWDNPNNITILTSQEVDTFGLSGFFGARYYLSENLAVFGEGGRGFSGASRFGITLRF